LGAFQDIVDDILTSGKNNDFIQVQITNPNAPGYEVFIPPHLQSTFDVNKLFDAASAAAQSSRSFHIEGEMNLVITRVDVVEGRGIRSETNSYIWEKTKNVISPEVNNAYHKSALTKEKVKEGRYYVTKETNNYCGLYAFLIGLKFWNWKRLNTEEAHKEYLDARRQKSSKFAASIDDIIEMCNFEHLEQRGMDSVDWHVLQQKFPDFKIKIYNGVNYNNVLFDGNVPPTYRAIITILYDQGHFAFASCPATLFNFRYECPDCGAKYLKPGTHKCRQRCQKCGNTACDGAPKKNDKALLTCATCHLPFYTMGCFEYHFLKINGNEGRSKCETFNKCKICGVCYSVFNTKRPEHTCEEKYCKNCDEIVPRNHFCFIKQAKTPKLDESKVFVTYYDIETTQHKKLNGANNVFLHEPVLICSKTTCDVCKNNKTDKICANCGVKDKILHKFNDSTVNVTRQFITFLYTKARGLSDGARKLKGRTHFVVAHNAKSFDAQFLLNEFSACKDFEIRSLILTGRKIMRAEIIRDYVKIILLDFINHVARPLAQLCKAFKLDPNLAKGSFPVFFIAPENYKYNENYLPNTKFWCPDSMTTKNRQEFLAWHEETNKWHVANQQPWNFIDECIKYCEMDVEILAQAAQAYRNGFDELDFDPLIHATTIAGTCAHIYRQRFMEKNTIGLLPKRGYFFRQNQSKIAIIWLLAMEKKLGIKIQHVCRGNEAIIAGAGVDGYFEDQKTGKKFVFQVKYYTFFCGSSLIKFFIV
jgi:hypothetical protein